MANTLTNLIPFAYAALDVVSRERVGYLTSVTRHGETDAAAINQVVQVPVTQTSDNKDITPANVRPTGADRTVLTVPVQITKQRMNDFHYTGEESYALSRGPGYGSIFQNNVQQSCRQLFNEMERDLAKEAALGCGSVAGTKGTTPFSNGEIRQLAELKKLMDDLGAPSAMRSFVMSTETGVEMRSIKDLLNADKSADTSMLRQGNLREIYDMMIKETVFPYEHTGGTANGALVNKSGGYAIGTTVVEFDGAGSGTILPGDVVTFAADTTRYVVRDVHSGTITLNAPGLRAAVADNAAITILGNYTADVLLAESSLVLATRLPKLPEGGDAASDRMAIMDPHSGMSLNLAVYEQFMQNSYQLEICWGVKAIKPEHSVLLLH